MTLYSYSMVQHQVYVWATEYGYVIVFIHKVICVL